MATETSKRIYYLEVQGVLEPAWSAWFEGLRLTVRDDTITELSGELDQAGLYGLIAQLRNLGLTLLRISSERV